MAVLDHAHAGRAVLYVEDNALNALLMEALFERRPDLRLHLASDCASALRTAQACRPALLLLDLRLPDGHGAALLPRLRALPGLRHLPAVAVTAEDLPGLDLQGFDDLWPKPLRLRQVLDQLDHWLPCQGRPDQGPAVSAVPVARAGWAPPAPSPRP
jgi:CheY-like chemotaxis protein